MIRYIYSFTLLFFFFSGTSTAGTYRHINVLVGNSSSTIEKNIANLFVERLNEAGRR